VQSSEPHATSLVEAHCIDVVVRRDEPESATPAVGRLAGDGGNEGRADARPLLKRVERDELTIPIRETEGGQPDDVIAADGEQRGKARGVVRRAAGDDDRRPPGRT
jgi:hypothetical protein